MEIDNYVKNKIIKLKGIIDISLRLKMYECSIESIASASRILYEYNQYYTDLDLENYTRIIADQMKPIVVNNPDDNVVLFVDGFGHDTRGLGLIYLISLLRIGKTVVYITQEKARNNQPQMDKEVKDYPFIRYYIPNGIKTVDKIKFIEKIYTKHQPSFAFMQILPFDVETVIVFERMINVKRYQINLTDHAFWLGVNAFDYCINFRDYGYIISRDFRHIDESKLIILPYYPYYNKDTKFEGLDFIHEEYRGYKIVFSGGDIYKTISKDMTYYEIVRKILEQYANIVFVYAGRNTSKYLNDLINEYPNRVYYIKERNDLYQLMQHIDIYLNTYPLLGGLMTQYAAIAGKIPLTLKHDQDGDDILLNQEKLGVFFDSKEELLDEMQLLMSDQEYLKMKEQLLHDSVITPENFQIELSRLMKEKKTTFIVKEKNVDVRRIRDDYKHRLTLKKVRECIIRKENKNIILLFPLLLIRSIMHKLSDKTYKVNRGRIS